MQKRIALLYDFDYTLAHGFMQEFGLMQDHGYDDVFKYFKRCEEIFDNRDVDMCLSMMGGVLQMANEKDRKVTREYLQSFGKDIKYYNGVEEWFDKINAIGREYGYEIEHYIISSGLKEIVEGSTIYPKLKRVYANFYCYNKNGEAYWPCQVVNYTSKTQYIFRVRKNALDDLSSLNKINAKMKDEELLPFKNIIYLGDSQTDIPSFKVIKNSGGISICVYDPDNLETKDVAHKCFVEGRVNYYLPADYTEGSELYELITSYIKNVMKKES
jgi:hypothetical protein